MRKTLSVAVVISFLVSMITILPAVIAQPYQKIAINPDGNIEGTDKIQQIDGICTFTNNVSGSVSVEMDGIVIDGSGFWLEGTGVENETGINLTNRTNITVRNLNITNFGVGIALFNTNGTTIINNNLTNNTAYPASIYLSNSSNNNVSKNLFEVNLQNAIWLRDFSNNNIISENTVNQNGNSGITVSGVNNTIYKNILDGSEILLSGYGKTNVVMENKISSSGVGGIWALNENSENTISQNTILDCFVGIQLDTSYNIVYENDVTGNIFGINFVKGEDNLFYQNNFVDNEDQVAFNYGGSHPARANIWSKQNQGNYWSDYNGTDNNGDGIGDTPYIIDENNQDNHPLMNPVDITAIPEFTSTITITILLASILSLATVYREKLGREIENS